MYTVYLLTHSLKESWLLPHFGNYKQMCINFCVDVCSRLIWLNTKEHAKLYVQFWKKLPSFLPKWLYHFAFPTTMSENSCCSTSLSAFGGVSISDLAILTLMLWYLVLISFFLVLYDVKHHTGLWIILFPCSFHFNFVLGYSQLTKL